MSSFLYLYITPVFPFSVLMKEWAVVCPGEGIEEQEAGKEIAYPKIKHLIRLIVRVESGCRHSTPFGLSQIIGLSN